MRALFFLKVMICSFVLNNSLAYAHVCELLSNEVADIMKYNQCIADQNRDSNMEKIINNYESEIEKLTQDNIRLQKRIAKIKSVLSNIISAY